MWNRRYFKYVTCDSAVKKLWCPRNTQNGIFFFFFQAEDGIRDTSVTGVHVCSSDLSVDLDTPSLVGFRILLFQAYSDNIQIGSRLFESDSRFETGQSEQSGMIVSLLPTGLGEKRAHRHPEVNFVGKFKSRGHDSQNGIRFPIEADRPIDNSGITAKSILPKCVADHGYRRGTRLIFVFAENPPDFRLRAQARKHIRRHQRPR